MGVSSLSVNESWGHIEECPLCHKSVQKSGGLSKRYEECSGGSSLKTKKENWCLVLLTSISFFQLHQVILRILYKYRNISYIWIKSGYTATVVSSVTRIAQMLNWDTEDEDEWTEVCIVMYFTFYNWTSLSYCEYADVWISGITLLFWRATTEQGLNLLWICPLKFEQCW